MTNITPFLFDQHPVRVIDRSGQPWFVASDIAEALEYREAKDMTRNLDDDESDRHILPIRSENGVEQGREVTIINESGLYSAILRSRKASAKRFKKWVTSEVLPAIRKTGEYVDTAQPQRKGKQKALPGALTLEQREAVQAMVLGRVRACDKQLQGAAAMKLWSIIKAKFGCSYKEIPADQFPEVLSLVARQELEGELLPAEPEPQPTPAATIRMPMEWLFEHNPRLNRERPLIMRPHGLLLSMGTLGAIERSAVDHLLDQLTKLGADVAAPRAEMEAWRHFTGQMLATAAMLTDQAKRMADRLNDTLSMGYLLDKQSGRPRR